MTGRSRAWGWIFRCSVLLLLLYAGNQPASAATGRSMIVPQPRPSALVEAPAAPVAPAVLEADPAFMIIASGSVSGVYYPVGGSLCRIVNRNRSQHGIRCSVESSTGSLYNFELLRAGEVNFAIVQSDLLRLAIDGQGPLSTKGPFPSLRSVFSLHVEPLTIVVAESAKVRSLQDLPGLRINIGPPGSGNRGTFGILMQRMGWAPDRFGELLGLRTDEQAQALCENQIDALVQVVGHPNAGIAEAVNNCGGEILPVAGTAAQQLLQSGLGYVPTLIPAGTYRRQTQTVAAIGPVAVLVTTQDVDTKLVRNAVHAIFTDLPTVVSGHPALAGLSAEMMTSRALVAPLHEGARTYYQEQGWVGGKP
jgi:uncharacterized protein